MRDRDGVIFLRHCCMSDNKLILCMIVRDESQVVLRAINSAKAVVDAICVCDTGSSDDTCDKVQSVLADFPGQLHEHVWSDFGTNRTMSFEQCVQCATDLGYEPSRTWALLLDADMVLCAGATFDKGALRETGYLVRQVHGTSLGYRNVRLVRLDQPWTCVGVTHEYWHNGAGCGERHNLDTLHIDDRGDGGCKADKFRRDLRLLTAGLARDPGNTRYLFYLAQTYRDLGVKAKAVELYMSHSRSDAWDEERWYSMMQVGLMVDSLDDKRKWLLNAFEFRPRRAEPLYHLADHCRLAGLNHQALMFAEQALAIPCPDDLLFVATDVYEYRCMYVVSICAYYTPFAAKGKAACERLLAMTGLPDDIVESTRKNAAFY